MTWDNTAGGNTNSDLELAALVLQVSYFPIISPCPNWHVPLMGSNNTPTVSWCFRKASTVNPIVANLLRIRAETNGGALLTPSVFYQPGPLKIMVDYASHRFDLLDNNFIPFFRSKYFPYQSAGLWTQCHPPSGITSCMISVLRRSMSGMAT